MCNVDDELIFTDDEDEEQWDKGAGKADPWTLLIVDDDPGIHTVTKVVLSEFYYDDRPLAMISAFSANEAWDILQQTNDIAVILLDVVMESDSAGLDLARRIRHVLDNQMVRIILRTGQPGSAPERKVILDYDINDYRAKSELTADNLFSSIIAGLRGYKDLVTISQLYNKLMLAHEATVVVLADVAEYKDTDTGEHVLRVKRYSEDLARFLKENGIYTEDVDEDLIARIGLASVLHDVGKVAIPDRILQKPGKLDAEEWKEMRTHAELGAQMLAKASNMIGEESYLSLGAVIAGNHHEKYDGSGYPKGLSQKDIPISARIVALTDVFDALTSKRPYKEPWPLKEAKQFLIDNQGTHFDPVLVDAFLKMLEQQGYVDE